MEALFLHLLNMSITGGWLVLAVILMRLIFKKAPKALLCALWAVVAVRLICPFSIESIVSLVPSAEPIPQEILVSPNPQIDSGVPIFNHVINPIIENRFTPTPQVSVNPLQVVAAVASYIWIAGLIAMLLYAVISYIRVYRMVRVRLRLQDNVYLCDAIDTPFIFGIIKPHIYLPSTLSKADRAFVSAHEHAHLKRLDHIWKPLGFALLSVYWFNPLLWIAYILLCRDIELACDEHVIRHMDKAQTAAYAEALLHCSTKKRFITACPLAFGESGVKARIKNALYYKKPTFWIVLAAVLACIAVTVCFLTNPIKPADNSGINHEPEGVSVSVKELDLAAETPSITILWKNNSDTTWTYGESFMLYRLENGTLVDCNLNANSGFSAIGYLLTPHQSIEETYNLSGYNLSVNGTYRFESHVNVHGGDPTPHTVSVDFQIEDGVIVPTQAMFDYYARKEPLETEKENVTAFVPQLYHRETDFDIANKFIRQDVEMRLYELQKQYPRPCSITLDYQILYQSTTYCCVLFEGSVTGGSLDRAVSVAFTLCVAPGNGYTIRPDSLFVIDNAFLESFRTGWLSLWDDANLTFDRHQDIVATINGYSDSELTAILRDGKTAEFAFTKDAVIVVFRGKPSIGDYVCIRVPYKFQP